MPVVTESIPTNTESGKQTDQCVPPGPAARIRYRIRFAKQGLLRWISHRDLARLWERMLRRGDFQLSMTEGFHPKPRIGFPSALALGVEGLQEVVEIELTEELAPQQVLHRLESDHQPGLTVHRVSRLPDGFGKAQLQRSDYTITTIDGFDSQAIRAAIERLQASESVVVDRKKKQMKVEIANQIMRLELGDQLLHLSLAASDTATLRPGDVLELLGCGDWVELGAQIVRVGVELQKDLDSPDPSVTATAARLPGSAEPTSTPSESES